MEVPIDAPWNAPHAAEWDSITVKEYLDANCWTTYSRNILEIDCRSLLCAEPHQVSLLAFLWYVASGDSLKRLTSITDGAQERKFVGGAMQLSERMADDLASKVGL